ncbi:MAG: hypothetical protein FWC98_02515 [Bacteroidales bacterium]|nr:hypothetical protein [Bacteroidales bacterium]
MKKILSFAIIPLFVLASCGSPAVIVDESTPATRVAGTVFTPNINLPEGETVETLVWTSSDESIAVVDNGVVMLVYPGAAEIVAATADGTIVETIALNVNGSCNINIPGFGESIGTASFATNQQWTIGSLTWSDAVQTTVCSNRETYHGGYWGEQNFNADCRSNPGQKGDLFTWCAVVRFQDELCPYPWRVPTQADFLYLDVQLGGDTQNRNDDAAIKNLYLSNWGATFSGYCSPSGVRGVQGTWAYYWSVSQAGATTGFMLGLSAKGFVGPRRDSVKYRGFSLRCVRDAN